MFEKFHKKNLARIHSTCEGAIETAEGCGIFFSLTFSFQFNKISSCIMYFVGLCLK